jgi:DNA primase
MARIAPEVIERVRNAADILEVVSQYVDLKRRGKNFFGLCPFHAEKTPSFSVAPDKEIYHCFGCGAGGNVFNFLMEYEKITFVEAVKSLGERYGIPVQLTEDKGSREFFTQLYELHALATEFYQQMLFSERGAKARAYLQERGFQEAILKQFKIGLAPEGWDALYSRVKGKGYTPDVLEKSGLFLSRQGRGGGYYDRFRNRIIFPIFNPSGKVVAFGGRTLDPEDPAKYLNSPETPLYHKSDVFYGLHATRDAIRRAGRVLLVEGYFDFLQLYQAGLSHVVAVSGTSLTERHVIQIRKFTDRVILAYDGDAAGVKAALRAGYLLLRGGVEPRVIAMPADLDPDDWVRQAGVAALQEAAETAQPLLKFHLQVRNARQLQGVEKSQFLQEIIREIAGITDGVIRDDLLRILSQDLQVDEQELVRRVQRERRRVRATPETPPEPTTPQQRFTSQVQKAQLELVKILAGPNNDARQLVRDNIDLNLFTDPLLKRLAELLLPQYGEIEYAAIIEHFQSKADREVVANILMEEKPPVDPEQIVKECTTVLAAHPIREQIKAARIKIRELEAAGRDSSEVILEVARLQQELKSLMSET